MTQQETFQNMPTIEEIHIKLKKAWDCTYGKGINPESVEKMKQALELADHILQTGNIAERGTLHEQIKEALTAAKLD